MNKVTASSNTPSNLHDSDQDEATNTDLKTSEAKALAFVIIVLFPLLTIGIVGGYGLIIWMIQAFGGIVSH